jgi:hypothetical protein
MKNEYVNLVEQLNRLYEEELQTLVSKVESERAKGNMGYIPGLTAISRKEGSISTIAKVIENKQLIKDGSRILHAGAGRPNNPDRAYLDTKGEVYHYDPGQDGSNDRGPIGNGDFDVVVSPFVLNVLSSEDRKKPINDMVSSLKTEGIAIVGVRGSQDINGSKSDFWEQWDDGYLVPKGNKIIFQKGFTPQELASELQSYFSSVEIVYNNKTVPIVKATK